MSPAVAEGHGRVMRFPRVSGDEPTPSMVFTDDAEFSPRERG